jgi:hypothetical protein
MEGEISFNPRDIIVVSGLELGDGSYPYISHGCFPLASVYVITPP